MKREDLNKHIKEKFLFEGLSGTGKSNLSMKITKIYAMNGKKILYIDPEHGTDRDAEKMFTDLSGDELANIELVHATNIDMYLKYMLGWEEERQAGSQVVRFHHGIDYDLKVCDGITTEIELYKTNLTQKFTKQGFYTIGEKNFVISNKDTFILPYNFYAKLYDQVKEALVTMLDHKYDVVCTIHPLKSTESQQDLLQSIYQKFDSVIRLNKIITANGMPKWNANIVKNRGRESPNVSSIMDDSNSVLNHFIRKFNMDYDETIKKLVYE